MYRLNDFNDLIDKGILDQIEQFEYIVIEWPKREEEYADENWKKIIIEKIDEKTRKIKI
jgi:tRNA A37 threonylcarbamoyladenosine biosynthesis protein TsaE